MDDETARVSITDPERIRALAHPLRLELLDLLGEVREATATECAERLGESVAGCSFHLRMLAKYGFVEPAPRRGREKPWRLVSDGMDVRPASDVPGSLTAVTQVAELTVLRQAERVRRYLAAAHTEPDEWLQASSVATSVAWLTVEETAELSRQVQHLTDAFLDRRDDPAARPAGARRVTLFGTVHPEPADRQQTPDQHQTQSQESPR